MLGYDPVQPFNNCNGWKFKQPDLMVLRRFLTRKQIGFRSKEFTDVNFINPLFSKIKKL